jgi:hypothetical protein
MTTLNPNGGHDMGHADIKHRVLKSVAQLEAERLTAFDELHQIADAIDLAALAAIGMAKELGGEEGEMLANYLRGQAERMRQAKEQLLTAPDESFSNGESTDYDASKFAQNDTVIKYTRR